ncbi:MULTISPECIES: alpha-galactosidase [unclassified Streptomyces]|uniref:alpha-galactosidase n=1 Tax=unclassified Streptomyces TaxID=2593676 RepID=UPI00331A74FE
MTEVHHDAAARPWMPSTPAGSHIVRLDKERRLRYPHRGARLTPERAATLPYATEVATDFDGEHAEDYPAEAGARFGVPDSDPHRADPAWVRNEPGRPSTEPRNQLVLDFGRPDVSARAHDWLDRLVRDHGADQLRWITNGGPARPVGHRLVARPGTRPGPGRLGPLGGRPVRRRLRRRPLGGARGPGRFGDRSRTEAGREIARPTLAPLIVG